jgi:hypothetical protein
VFLGTALAILLFSLPRIPRDGHYGPDTIADMYGARVVLNDVSDMYTKAHVEQTAVEAATWTKEESAPYPPAVRLTQAAMLAIGQRTGIGFYGLTLLLAVVFLAASAWYFLQTRWYLFPLLHLNFSFFADRFVYVQDGSYLVMLTCVMGALLLARHRHRAAPLLMAVATTMKLLPLYYVRHVVRMPRSTALAYIAILLAGLVLPWFVWDGYLDIYRYATERKGNDLMDVGGALLIAVPFTLLLWHVEERRGFDAADRIGWSLIPFALFAALLANSGRHLLIALIVPDKRVGRNLAAAIGLALHTVFPDIVRLGSVAYVTAAALIGVLLYELHVGRAFSGPRGADVTTSAPRSPRQAL